MWRAHVYPSRAWLVGVLAALALAVAIALGAGCGVDVPLGVDPHSDAAVSPTADAATGGG
ncbi:MAG TPA: hypothetical protein VKZ18_24300 [Polyangia bacterium]|nr:hypothetical protein [Polyangia bacterium]